MPFLVYDLILALVPFAAKPTPREAGSGGLLRWADPKNHLELGVVAWALRARPL